jgi:hypothetical protein
MKAASLKGGCGATRESHTSLLGDKPSRSRSWIELIKRCHSTEPSWRSQHPSYNVVPCLGS